MDEPDGSNPPPARATTILPPAVVVLLRGALYAELGRACEDAPVTVPECKSRAGWMPVLRRINSAVVGLNAIGWVEPDEQEPVTIALDAALIEVLETDAEQWEWTSRQEKIESDEGRARAAEYADTINRFLATLSQHPTPEPTTLLSDAGGHAGKDAPARDGAMSPLPEGHGRTLGPILRAVREERGKTRERLAVDAGLAAGTLARLELDKSDPCWNTITAVADALGLTLAELGKLVDDA